MLRSCQQYFNTLLPAAAFRYAYRKLQHSDTLTTSGGSDYACIVFDTSHYRAALQSGCPAPDDAGVAALAVLVEVAGLAATVAAGLAAMVVVPAGLAVCLGLVVCPDSAYDSYSLSVLPAGLPVPALPLPVPAAAMPADRSGHK